MRRYFFISYLLISVNVLSQNSSDCGSYLGEPVIVVIDTIWRDQWVTNNGRPGRVCVIERIGGPSALRPVNPQFEIVSFVISMNSEDYIIEVPNQGGYLSASSKNAYLHAVFGSEIYFYCIRARHVNGKVYTLKPVTIRR